MAVISLDTETTGLDLHHGAKPFFVTSCDLEGNQTYWEWEVEPTTREPIIPEGDLDEIEALIGEEAGHTLILQNSKFDFAALQAIWPHSQWDFGWDRVEDTLIAAHLLDSISRHDLTALTTRYLRRNINAYEDALQKAVQGARRKVRLKSSKIKHWRIAKAGLPEMPSAKEKTWKFDSWLPRTMARHLKLPKPKRSCKHEWASNEICERCKGHRWWVVLREYANKDSWATVQLWPRMKRLLQKRGLWSIYQTRRKVPRIAYTMEQMGITLSSQRLEKLAREYEEGVQKASQACVEVASSFKFDLPLPKGGRNKKLNEFVFDVMKLPVVKETKKGNPSLDKYALEVYEATLPQDSRELRFVSNLRDKRKRDTSIGFLKAYQRFWHPHPLEIQDAIASSRLAKPQVLAASKEDQGLLVVDGGIVRQRVRTVQGDGGSKGTQSSLQDSSGGDTTRPVGAAQLRQPGLRKPPTPISRHAAEQHARYDSQGQGRQGKGYAAPSSSSNRLGRAGDTQGVQTGEKETRRTGSAMPSVQDQPSAHARDYSQKVLEALEVRNWALLHPNLNPTGTNTLRWSSQSPNEQNISKQEEKCNGCEGKGFFLLRDKEQRCPKCKGEGTVSFNLRYCFGPAPGREWWSLDAKNIELRLPAYESGEEELIALFERPNEAPYYGSNHLLIFHTLHTKLWEEELGKVCNASCCKGKVVDVTLIGPHCKKKYASTWYQWVKNGNFAVQYGAVDKDDGTGTADLAYHMPGAQKMIAQRFVKQEALNQYWIQYAERHGYVETMPDTRVNANHGYPVMCTRTERNTIKPTVPLNYHVQSTAMWWMMMAMIQCQEQLDEWNRRVQPDDMYRQGYFMVIQVHDEIVFDFPRRANPLKNPKQSNLGRIYTIQRLMEQNGSYLVPRVPTPVGVEYHPNNWAIGMSI